MEQAADQVITFKFNAKTYRVPPRSAEVEQLFRRRLERRALEAIRRHEEVLTADERRTHAAAWQASVATGTYDVAGVLWWEALLSEDGAKEMAYLQLNEANPLMSRDVVGRIYADEAAWAALMAAIAEAHGRGSVADAKPK